MNCWQYFDIKFEWENSYVNLLEYTALVLVLSLLLSWWSAPLHFWTITTHWPNISFYNCWWLCVFMFVCWCVRINRSPWRFISWGWISFRRGNHNWWTHTCHLLVLIDSTYKLFPMLESIKHEQECSSIVWSLVSSYGAALSLLLEDSFVFFSYALPLWLTGLLLLLFALCTPLCSTSLPLGVHGSLTCGSSLLAKMLSGRKSILHLRCDMEIRLL